MSGLKNGRHVNSDGVICWYKDGRFHREDGPAVEYADGSKQWFQNGKLHREDGPAIENKDFTLWFLNDVEFSEDEFNQWLEKKKLNEKLHSTLEEKPSTKKSKI